MNASAALLLTERRRTHRASLRMLLGLSAVHLLSACADGTPAGTAEMTGRDGVLGSIVGTKSGIVLDGERFNYAGVSLRRTADNEIGAAAATNLADALAPQFSSWKLLEASRGAAIQTRSLRACGAARYAASRFEPLDESVSLSIRRRYGPYWLIPMCAGGPTPIAEFAVSALAQPVSAGVRGELVIPTGADVGGVYYWTGIPAAGRDWVPASPEASALEVVRHVGGHLAALPELVAPDPESNLPTHASWRITLTEPRRAREADGATVQATQFEVAPRGDFRAPATREVRVLTPGSEQRRVRQVPTRGGPNPPLAELRLRSDFVFIGKQMSSTQLLP